MAVSKALMLIPRRTNLFAAYLRAIAVTLAIAMFAAPRAYADAAAPSTSAVGVHGMVVSESDDAAHAGVEILKQGGNAVDAALATELAVGVTNPAACGIGGGGFMLIYIAKAHAFYALDYRETPPLTARSLMYMRNGKPDEDLARDGILGVGVPGEIAGIDSALRRFGTMKGYQIAAPAEKLGRDGYVASPHLAKEIETLAPKLKDDPGLSQVFLKPDGSPLKAGDTIVAKNLAATLKSLGDDPVASFYHGEIATALVAFMKAHGGLVSSADLLNYRPDWRDPIRRRYEDYEVYTMPPPSSGGVVLEMLGALDSGHLSGLGVNSPPYLARLIEVMRQGFIDREQYADPSFVGVNIQKLLTDENILQLREHALHPKTSPTPAAAAHDHGTSNLLVADKDGNVVAITTTINTVFGSKLSVPALGIILNDEMDDFADNRHEERRAGDDDRRLRRSNHHQRSLAGHAQHSRVPSRRSQRCRRATNSRAGRARHRDRRTSYARGDAQRARADGLQAQGRVRARRGRRDHDRAGESARRGRSAQGRRRRRLLAIAPAR